MSSILDVNQNYYLTIPLEEPRLESLVTREWLELDGKGGWSSSTLACVNTRRYHGLLVSNDDGVRRVLVSSLQDSVIMGGSAIPLSSNKYPGVIHPGGWSLIKSVYTGVSLRVEYVLEGGVLVKEIVKRDGETSVGVSYSWSGLKPIQISVLPFFAFRNFHCLQNRHSAPSRNVQREDFGVSVKPFLEMEKLWWHFDCASMEDQFEWYYNNEYEIEKKRGLDYSEDLFSLFKVGFTLDPEKKVSLVCSTGSLGVSPSDWIETSLQIRKKYFDSIDAKSIEDKLLAKHLSGSIIKSRRGRRSLVAGYHWFEEWGRDTFISLPMMFDLFKSAEEVAEIYLDFLENAKLGLIPNRFTGGGENIAEYNSVDASLWLVVSYYQALEYFKNADSLLGLFPLVRGLVESYLKGSLYGIKVLENGLLTQGSEGEQLTWMDARVNGIPITPRDGLAVEINSLWYNALLIVGELSKNVGDTESFSRYSELSAKVKQEFRSLFMDNENSFLYDTVGGAEKDLAFRPNQLFAIALPFSLLDQREARILLFNIREKLVTPRGLRTLSRDSRDYVSHFRGGPLERDSGYHQGTVWPWLLEYYRIAVQRYAESELRAELEVLVDCFNKHIVSEACVGSVSEVFDAEDPYLAGGTCSQTWSIGAIRSCRMKLLS
jgi:predicted glycogen debranching enzyme